MSTALPKEHGKLVCSSYAVVKATRFEAVAEATVLMWGARIIESRLGLSSPGEDRMCCGTKAAANLVHLGRAHDSALVCLSTHPHLAQLYILQTTVNTCFILLLRKFFDDVLKHHLLPHFQSLIARAVRLDQIDHEDSLEGIAAVFTIFERLPVVLETG